MFIQRQGWIDIVSTLLESFCYNIQYDRHGGHIENLQLLSAPKW